MKIQISLFALCLTMPGLARAVPVEITVADAKGAPVAGARVQVESVRLDDRDQRITKYSSAQSDAAGVAKFDLEPYSENSTYFGRATAFKAGLALGGVELRKDQRAIQLAASIAATGTVRDEKGAPVAGARVRLQQTKVAPDGEYLFFFGEGATQFRDVIETQTDAQGVWRLDGLTKEAEYSVDIQAPGFAQTGASAKVSDGPIATTLQPEARVAGQLLAPNGKPLAGVEITPFSAESRVYIEPLVTDARGKFQANGLSAGKWFFAVDLAEQPFVTGDFATIELKIGDNVLPPIELQTGVVVRGSVRDTNGVPVDMSVTTSVPGQNSATATRTDAKGDFEMRVPVGERIFNLRPSDNSFRKTNEPKAVTVAAGDTPQVAWVLERAPVVRGVITDENGAPIEAPFIFVKDGDRNLNGNNFKTDKNGRFETPIDMDGAARILGQVGKNGQFKIIGSNRVVLPAKGELKFVARLENPVIFRARAVDGDGKPLANVEFVALAMGDASYESVRLQSDENGDLKSDNLGTGAQLQGAVADLKGYTLRAPIEVIKDGDNWTSQPLVFDRRDAELKGQVLDVSGKPTANARVLAGGVETASDAAGAWALKDLPPGALLVSALSDDGQSFASARTPLGGALQLKKAQLIQGDEILARSVLEQLKTDAKDTEYKLKDRLVLPVQQSFIEQIKDYNQRPNRSPVVLFYTLLNQTNDAENGELEDEKTQTLLEGWQAMLKRTDRITAASALMEARPDWKDAAGASDFVFQLEEDVNGELAGQDPEERRFRLEGVFALAAAFETLGQTDETLGQTESADRAFKNAVKWTFKIPDADNNGELGREALLSRGIGAFGNAPRLFGKLLNYFDPETYWHHRALGEIIAPTARARGLAAAVPYLEQLRDSPDSRPARVQGDEMPYSPVREMPRVVQGAILAGGQKEPALALKLAQEVKIVSFYGEKDLPNPALIAAAFWQSPAVAAEIWRAQLPKLSPVEAIEFAARIAKTDENLARELYEEARVRLEKLPTDSSLRFTYNSTRAAEFAFTEAQFAPARAQFRLEQAWPNALKEANTRHELSRYVLAMARLNPQRSLEMALEIPNDKDYSGFDARYSLARALAGDNTGRGVISNW